MSDAVLQTAMSKATRRLLPLLVIIYFFAVLDRVNIGVAGLTMRQDLGLNASAFGFGAGIFFLGYLIFEIPSNLILERVGARIWLTRIIVTWGLAAMAVALARGAASLAVFRFLLGLAEAGFFPGVVFYLSLWFPVERRARVNALFFLGLPVSNSVATALSSLLLSMHGVLGLAGWQWLFLIEGAPPVLLGVLVFMLLPDGPAKAKWLSPAEKDAVSAALRADQERIRRPAATMEGLRSPVIWLLGFAFGGLTMSLTSLAMWSPQLIHSLGNFSAAQSGLIAAGVLLPGALAMVLWSRHSDKRGERVGHVVVGAIVTAVGWVLCAVVPGPVAGILLLTLASAGTYATFSIFWTVPTELFSGRAAAGGIALIGAVGNLGGFIGPWVIGRIHDVSGTFAGGFGFVALTMLATAAITWRVGVRAGSPRLARAS